MRTVGVYNIKGGVGKTAAAVNVAWLAARDGVRTLLWDLDPQGAATYYYRIEPRVKGGGERIVAKRRRLGKLVKETDYRHLDLVPADFSYRNLDLVLEGAKGGRDRLRRILEVLADDYDLVLLDCAPSISLVSENVFRAADALLVPLIPTPLSLRTWDQLRDHLASESGRAPELMPFFSMVDRRRALHREIVEDWQQSHADALGSVIPYASSVEHMGTRRAPLGAWTPSDRAALAFAILWAELRIRLWPGEGAGGSRDGPE